MADLELKLAVDGRNKFLSFVDEDTLLTYSSNAVLFLKVESGEISVFRPTALRNVDIVAVHTDYRLFAVAERGIKPKLQVFKYPECKFVSNLEGVAQLEYVQLSFSNSVYLAACSGVPEFKISIWDVYTGVKMVEADYDMDVHPASISFNPGNWHQLAVVSTETGRLSMWNIEQSSKSYSMRRNDVRLPFTDDSVATGTHDPETSGINSGRSTSFPPNPSASPAAHATVKSPRIGVEQPLSPTNNLTNTQRLNQIDIPRHAMAEIVDPFAEEFEAEPFDRQRLFATSATFNSKNELLVACKSGHLLSVSFAATYESMTNNESQAAVFSPRTANRTRFSYAFNPVLQPRVEETDSDRAQTAEDVWHPQPGDLDRVVVHASGIICIGANSGLVRVVTNAQPHRLMCQLETGAAGLIAASLSPHYDHLAVFTSTRSVLLLTDFAGALPHELNNDNSVKEESDQKSMYALNVKELPGTNAMVEPSRHVTTMFRKPFVATFHFGAGKAVAAAPLGMETDALVLLTSGGSVQVWEMANTLRQIGAIFLPNKKEDGTEMEWNIMASCPALRLVVAGTLSGEIHFVDFSTPQHPRLVVTTRLSRRAIVGLRFDPFAQLLIAIAADNTMFIIDPRPSKSFQIVGFTTLPGDLIPTAFSVLSTADPVEGKVSVAIGYKPIGDPASGPQTKPQVPQVQNQNQFTKVALYQLDAPRLKQSAPDLYVHAIRREFKEVALGRLLLTIATPSTALLLVDHHRICCLAAGTGRLVNFSLAMLISTASPQTPSTASTDGTPSTAASSEIIQPIDYGSPMPSDVPMATGFARSPDAKWLLLSGVDGRVSIVHTDDQSRVHATTTCALVDPRLGGILQTSVTSSPDNRYLMAAGRDGSAVIMQFGFTRTTSGRSTRSSEQGSQNGWANNDETRKWFDTWRSRCRDLSTREVRLLESIPVYMPPKKREEKEKDKEQAAAAAAAAAQASPHGPSVYEVSPIKLPPDATAVESLTARAIYSDDEKVKDAKSEILAALVHIRERLHDMMTENMNKPDLEKLDHYDFDLDAAEQTRLLQEGDAAAKKLKQQLEAEIASRITLIQRIKRECFDALKVKSKGVRGMISPLRVNNYPLKDKTSDELAVLEMIRKIRECELAEFKTRASDNAADGTVELAALDETDGGGGAAGGQNAAGDGPADGSEDVVTPANKDEAMHQQGSFASQFGADCKLHYDQFALQTRDQKLIQIALIKDAIYTIKEAFNKEFEEACRKKENEMTKITEKNRRLRQIQDLIEVFDKAPVAENFVQYEPHPVSSEDTEQLFNVADTDVPAEKWISPADRKKMEEAAKAEKERLLRERGDNPRERGLQDMMGGVLEVKKEDELRKEIPTPTFMVEGKPESEWNEEEQKLAQDYQKRSKELAEERERYRKVVDVEAKKLRQQVQESVTTYEDLLSELFRRKLKTEMVIHQEEMKISRIQLELVVEASFASQIEELRRRLDTKRSALLMAQKNVADARKLLSETQETYDVLVAEDKILDKGFRREFSDVNSQFIDQLLRQFRRRPKGLKSGPQLIQAIASAAGTGNPWAERPATATQHLQFEAQLESALVELDRETNCPEGVDSHVWKRLCDYRRQKIEKEFKKNEQALAQAESQAFLAHRLQDEETVRQEIERFTMDIARLESEFERFILNLEVQLIVKQGQVEVRNSHPRCVLIPDFNDAVLVHRSVVEQLNTCILQKGAAKIANMERAKKTKRDIVRLEWEHRRLQMEMTDLDQKIHDIDHLRLTREVQEFLSSPDYDSRVQKDLAQLEQTLVAQQQYHQKSMERLRQILNDVDRTQQQREGSNNEYDFELDSLNVKVCEQRRLVEVTSGEMEIDAARRRRIAAVVNRSRLVEVARAQASEIAVLRQEVERLRLKTFPALVQLD